MFNKLLNDAMLAAFDQQWLSEFFATVGTEDVILESQETSANQGHAATLAVETVVVPLTLLK